MDPLAPLSVYIHIPFCETRCSYCAFNVYTDLSFLVPQYIDALLREIEFAAAKNPHREIHTIYFGGGTPSLLPAHYYGGVLQRLERHFPLAVDAEVSMETNPNDLSTAYLSELREIGINRLSIGMHLPRVKFCVFSSGDTTCRRSSTRWAARARLDTTM